MSHYTAETSGVYTGLTLLNNLKLYTLIYFLMYEKKQNFIIRKDEFVCKIREYIVAYKVQSVGKVNIVMYRAVSYFTMC